MTQIASILNITKRFKMQLSR